MSTPVTVAQRLQSDRLKFPGLLPEETLIARTWLGLYQHNYSGFQYNVRIGDGDDPGPAYPQYARDSAIANSQLRLDCVAWQNLVPGYALQDDTAPSDVYAANPIGQPTIVEFKRRAATAAIAQLSAYGHLWANDFPHQIQPFLLLVANAVSATIIPILNRANIQLVTVQVDFSVLRRTSTYTSPPKA